MSIIWMDWYLAITGILFLILSWLYAVGLLRILPAVVEFFGYKYRFRWVWASVTGILCVCSCLATLVFYPRYGSMAWDIYWSLFVIFSLALPGMVWVGRELERECERREQCHEAEVLRLRREVAALNEKLRSVQLSIKTGGDKALPMVENILEMSECAYQN